MSRWGPGGGGGLARVGNGLSESKRAYKCLTGIRNGIAIPSGELKRLRRTLDWRREKPEKELKNERGQGDFEWPMMGCNGLRGED